MKKNLFFLLFLSVCFLSFGNPVKQTIEYGGMNREYLLYVPQNSEESPHGIIVALHGFNRTMDDFFEKYSISDVADALNYLVLSPQALPEQDSKVINAAETIALLSGYEIPLESAWGCGLRVIASMKVFGFEINLLNEELNKQIDDSGFIREIVKLTKETHSLKTGDVFIFGTSLGGYMAYQLALKQGEELNGIISVAGSMGLSIKDTNRTVSLPVCDFHSTTDEVVPYSGSLEQLGVTIKLAEPKSDVIDFWVKKNNIQAAPVTEQVNYYPATNDIRVEKITYPDVQNEVIHYKASGADHSYFFRKENGDCMDMGEEIAKFISAHSTKIPNNIDCLTDKHPIFYPNPATDKIYFDFPEGIFSIYTSFGQLILSGKFNSGQADISSLKPRIYFITIQNENKLITSKLIKK